MNYQEERIGEILKQLGALRYSICNEITGWKISKQQQEEINIKNYNSLEWKDFNNKDVWGGDKEYYMFSTTLVIPKEYEDKITEFYLATGREGQWDATNPQFRVYVNGELRQGLDVNHQTFLLTQKAVAGEEYHIFLAAYTGDKNDNLQFKTLIRTIDPKIEKFYYDCLVPWQIAGLLDKQEAAYIRILDSLNNSVNLLDLRKPYSLSFDLSLQKARDYLEKEFYQKCSDQAEATVYCVGHTHIDVAWLWTLAVTKDKAVRSFSTVVELMKQYPEYVFMSSQPQLYQYVKEKEPRLYEEIRRLIKEGRWEAEGGMFLEADCNLASGESLVRQFLYGTRFFQKEFGVTNSILWLPDVFGYSAALPQIMKKCGISYFMTTKISWNEVNKMPYDSFYWEGIDGSRILTHFIPSRDFISDTRSNKTNSEHTTSFSTNYNGYICPSQIKGAWQRYQQKELNTQVLMSYGYGDGGGGPTKEMLEVQRRLQHAIPGCPATKQSTAKEFFHKLEEELKGKEVPLWHGELYLEYHRATYTSMARNKRYNRRSEFEILNTELWQLLAKQKGNMDYPKALLLQLWEILMRNQFHDILPGSSIKEVYEDSRKEYEYLLEELDKLQSEALQAVTNQIDTKQGALVVFNPNGFIDSGLIKINKNLWEKSILSKSTFMNSSYQLDDEDNLLLEVEAVPAKGYKTICLEENYTKEQTKMILTETIAENRFYRIQLNEKGQFTSIYDKEAGRELLKEGQCGNVLMTYEDKPHNYDNWNLYSYYKEKSWEIDRLVSAKVIEQGPVRYALQLKWTYLDSSIEETIYFYPNDRQIDIKTDIDWKEQQIFVKALFPLAINNKEACYDIQYGNVKRNMIQNTSWDSAKFEVCYHKWMDISEDDYGISFLNDCKYGVSVEDNLVGLSFIKSGIYPNPDADKEKHSFVYSIYPHMGDWKKAKTAVRAYRLNNPMTVYMKETSTGRLSEQYSFISVQNENIMVDVVKEAEDSDHMIIRFYEYYNRRTEAVLEFDPIIQGVYLCDMLENIIEPLSLIDHKCTLTVKPFEIVTLMVTVEAL